MKIDTIELPSDLIWENEFWDNDVRTAIEEAVGGGKVVWEDSGNFNPNIDLVGDESSGCLTRAQMESLTILANVPGATYELDYNGWATYQVRFRNEDKPAIEGQPVKDMPSDQYESGDYYNNIRIKLMKVG